MTQDVGRFIRVMQTDVLPKGTRGVAAMDALWDATWAEWQAVAKAYEDANLGASVWAGKEVWERDAAAFQARMHEYRSVLDTAKLRPPKDEDTLQLQLQGFFLGRFPGQKHPVPDFAMPRSLANGLEALGIASQANTFDRAFDEALAELPETLGRWAGATGKLAGSAATRLLSGLSTGAGLAWTAVALVAAVLWFKRKARRRGP